MTRGRGITRPRRGPAGLLMALFVVAGLMFSYGLGHGPPRDVCTAHLVSVPADVAAAMAGTTAAAPGAAAFSAPAFSAPAFTAPLDLPPISPADAACVCLAVLLGLMALGLASKRRGAGTLLSRSTRSFLPPAGEPPFLALSLASLQVLRL
ncbi:hypothetical protein [Actinomadura sp. 9N407]|uniref:hypothetical protein n=1 Tax=Actinomadura sp. 9N407 TaxID=3375154 RepID=UPI003794E279